MLMLHLHVNVCGKWGVLLLLSKSNKVNLTLINQFYVEHLGYYFVLLFFFVFLILY